MRDLPAAPPGHRASTPAGGVRPRLSAARPLLAAPIAALLLALALAGSAQANAGNRIIKLCEERKSIAGFSEKAYSQALAEMNADDDEYSDCPELIAEQEQDEAGAKHRSGSASGGGGAGVGGGRAGGGSSGGTGAATAGQQVVPNAEEQKQIAQVQSKAPKHVAVGSGGGAVAPGVVHASVASAVNSLPVPVLAAIAALAALVALLAGRAVRDRMRLAGGEG